MSTYFLFVGVSCKKIITSEHLFSNISDINLDRILRDIKKKHPSAGEIMSQAHLRSKNIKIQRKRLRESLHRIDPAGIASRSRHTIRRRVYSVRGPNFLWHIDGTHKLIRWRLLVHVGVDGFSRLITFCQLSNNNKSRTVLALFDGAILKYGTPLRIRTDEGGENVLIWNKMTQLFPLDTNPVIVGSSVHNQRVERMHRDINDQVINHFYNLFYKLESNFTLNPENLTDLFCLHFTFIPIINQRLHEFMLAHNNHAISTESNFTPLQLFMLNIHLRDEYVEPDREYFGGILLSAIDINNLPYVNVLPIECPITPQQFELLKQRIDPLSYLDPADAFFETATFVAECLNDLH